MKYLYILFLIVFISLTNVALAQNQKINCDSLCVTNIGLSNDTLHVTLYNGDSTHINYPLIKVIYQGDTVANQTQFNFFAHMGKSTQTHSVKTTLTSLPANFVCKVVVIDPLWEDTCVIDYPCAPGQHNSIKNPYVSASFKLYPNPVKNQFRIEFNSGKATHNLTAIISANGSIVSTARISSFNNYMIDVSALPAGMYFLQLNDGDKMYVEKFVKE